jgi:hypothetical protein
MPESTIDRCYRNRVYAFLLCTRRVWSLIHLLCQHSYSVGQLDLTEPPSFRPICTFGFLFRARHLSALKLYFILTESDHRRKLYPISIGYIIVRMHNRLGTERSMQHFYSTMHGACRVDPIWIRMIVCRLSSMRLRKSPAQKVAGSSPVRPTFRIRYVWLLRRA